ncbi:TetR/AcrR family transcriptional regulator [Nocardia sp. NBC_01327]|uniref:TetR/AcrR family transcriptional regulator n=1 Tax=Nocardia sp. NBC_01327 TaxID=2903593 RepID=UPI002E155E3F|nr:TetR family transcriptional regulator [Nocardia sp. NBC_01327]
MSSDAAKSRRSPQSEERVRDAERSGRALVDAALSEFSAKGYAGTRIQDIANRAGLNKQLISYYFGGKEGLYREIQGRSAERGKMVAETDQTLEEIALQYLDAGLRDPRYIRLALWRGLTDPAEFENADVDALEDQMLDQDVTNIERAQARGEIAADLDPGFVRLILMSIVMAPGVLPRSAHHLLGHDPGSAEFRAKYGEQVQRLIAHLQDHKPDAS